MKEIEAGIKTGNFKQVYLLYGEERYLVRHYEKSISNAAVAGDEADMNIDVFEGKSVSVQKAIDAAMTTPYLANYRVIILRDTSLFEVGKKGESETMSAFLKHIPESTIIIFVETKIDKRNALYKNVSKQGLAHEFTYIKETDLREWANRHFKNYNSEIDAQDIYYLIRRVGCDMSALASEIQKLALYKGAGNEITRADIDNVCKKSLELSIFELVGAAANKNAGLALDIFNNLLLMKESPIMVIVMVARQLRIVLQCKILKEKGLSPQEISTQTGLRSFIVSEALTQSVSFSAESLKGAISKCLEADLNIKTGKMTDTLAVEMLILKICL